MTKHAMMVTKMDAKQFTLLWDAVKDKEVGDKKRQEQKRNKTHYLSSIKENSRVVLIL